MTNNTVSKTKGIYFNERIIFSFVFCLLLVVIDQISKYFIFKRRVQNYFIVPFENHNFAFSLHVPVAVMYLIYVAVLLSIFYYLLDHYQGLSKVARFAWSLILAGAISNIFERIALGYVRDFIFILNGIFNLADFYIILGIVILLTEAGIKSREEGTASEGNP